MESNLPHRPCSTAALRSQRRLSVSPPAHPGSAVLYNTPSGRFLPHRRTVPSVRRCACHTPQPPARPVGRPGGARHRPARSHGTHRRGDRPATCRLVGWGAVAGVRGLPATVPIPLPSRHQQNEVRFSMMASGRNAKKARRELPVINQREGLPWLTIAAVTVIVALAGTIFFVVFSAKQDKDAAAGALAPFVPDRRRTTDPSTGIAGISVGADRHLQGRPARLAAHPGGLRHVPAGRRPARRRVGRLQRRRLRRRRAQREHGAHPRARRDLDHLQPGHHRRPSWTP